ncbi:MAG: S8 family peptidase [Candidatus Porifericomitaceae bacterium WSBS_2022_MAG_OTU9]
MLAQILHIISRFSLGFALVVLASCGGGGGGPSPSPSPSVSSSVARSSPPTGSESENSFGLMQVISDANSYSTPDGMGQEDYSLPQRGAGVVLGQVDSGVYWRGANAAARIHSELQGQVITPPTAAGARNPATNMFPTPSDADHGTTTGGIMVARRDGIGIHGIAPGARLRIRTFDDGARAALPELREGEGYVPIDISDMDVRGGIQNLGGLLSELVSQADVFAINNSWGFEGTITEYTATGIRAAFGGLLSTWAQAGATADNRKILVWTTGNAGDSQLGNGDDVDASSPELLGGLAHFITELQGHSLAVASVKVDGTISSFSNHCGVAAAFCLAAPGEYDRVYWRLAPNPGAVDNVQSYDNTGEGSSFSAPLVTGALALLKERFDTMGNTALVTRLLATATKTGIYGDSSIYGQGLLNVDAALTMAIGPIAIRTGSSLGSSRSHSSADSGFELSGPLSSLRSAAAGYEIEGYDDIGTPFRLSLQNWLPDNGGNDALQRLLAARFLDGSLLSAQGDGSYTAAYRGVDAEGRHLSGSRLWHGTGGGSGWWFASGSGAERRFAEPLFAGVQGFASPFNGMAEGGFAFGVQGEVLGEVLGGKALWQLESYVPGYHHSTDSMRSLGVLASVGVARGSVPWRVTAGLLREGESVLGSRGRGAFAGADASTWHGGLELAHHSGDWSYYASGYVGVTSGSGSADIWQGVDSVYSSSWAIGLVRRSVFSSADAVGLRLVQSLRAESGDVRLRLPDSRDTLGNLYSKDVNLRLEPDGRELDLALSWQRAVYGGSFSMDVGITTQPNHVSGESSRAWAGLAWLHRF